MFKCGIDHARFFRATHAVAATQAQLLQEILRANRNTAFGIAHDFGRIADPRAYQAKVPPATYEDFAESIARIGAGEQNVLTREPVQRFEPTSGTTGGEKLIPYTAGLRRQFERGIAAWIADLFRRCPAVRQGRAYWSISPAFGPPRRTPCGIPIGFADDAAYLGRLERCFLPHLLVVPKDLARLSDMTTFRYCTLLYLLAAADLSLISVWSPSFLTALLSPLPEWIDRLCHDLRSGTINPPIPKRNGLHHFAHLRIGPNAKRADRLAAIWRGKGTLAKKLRQVWPMLAMISCWTDAAAAGFVADLRDLFPGVWIQPKGLLATEGFVSLPLVGQPGAALALRCHFFEFEEIQGSAGGPGPCRLAHELERGRRYRVVITTAGGLYRYQLRDEVEVVGFLNECPLLRFLGKSDLVSDLVGEKLAETHVRNVLDRMPALQALNPHFMMMVPVLSRPAHYRLYLQGPKINSNGTWLDKLTSMLQDELEVNPYYRHAVAAGQLGRADIIILDPDAQSARQVYERRCLVLGQRVGTIKPVVLERWTGWPELFDELSPAAAIIRK
jgi:hypothetical protein